MGGIITLAVVVIVILENNVYSMPAFEKIVVTFLGICACYIAYINDQLFKLTKDNK